MTQRCCASTGTAARQGNATRAREPTAEHGRAGRGHRGGRLGRLWALVLRLRRGRGGAEPTPGKRRYLEEGMAEVERVNARLEEAALTTARALGDVSRH